MNRKRETVERRHGAVRPADNGRQAVDIPGRPGPRRARSQDRRTGGRRYRRQDRVRKRNGTGGEKKLTVDMRREAGAGRSGQWRRPETVGGRTRDRGHRTRNGSKKKRHKTGDKKNDIVCSRHGRQGAISRRYWTGSRAQRLQATRNGKPWSWGARSAPVPASLPYTGQRGPGVLVTLCATAPGGTFLDYSREGVPKSACVPPPPSRASRAGSGTSLG